VIVVFGKLGLAAVIVLTLFPVGEKALKSQVTFAPPGPGFMY